MSAKRRTTALVSGVFEIFGDRLGEGGVGVAGDELDRSVLARHRRSSSTRQRYARDLAGPLALRRAGHNKAATGRQYESQFVVPELLNKVNWTLKSGPCGKPGRCAPGPRRPARRAAGAAAAARRDAGRGGHVAIIDRGWVGVGPEDAENAGGLGRGFAVARRAPCAARRRACPARPGEVRNAASRSMLVLAIRRSIASSAAAQASCGRPWRSPRRRCAARGGRRRRNVPHPGDRGLSLGRAGGEIAAHAIGRAGFRATSPPSGGSALRSSSVCTSSLEMAGRRAVDRFEGDGGAARLAVQMNRWGGRRDCRRRAPTRSSADNATPGRHSTPRAAAGALPHHHCIDTPAGGLVLVVSDSATAIQRSVWDRREVQLTRPHVGARDYSASAMALICRP